MNDWKIRGIIDRIENNSVVIRTDFSEIIWPKDKLPSDAKEGSIVYLDISTEPEEEKRRDKLAKSLLNEILSGQDEEKKEE